MNLKNFLTLLFVASSLQSNAIDITDLYKLIKENNLKAIKELDNNFDWSQKTKLGRNSLMIAAALGRNEIVQFLLTINNPAFDINDHDNNGTTAYMFAVWNGDRKTVNLFDSLNVDKDLEDHDGEDFIYYAQKDYRTLYNEILDDMEETKKDINYDNMFVSASEFLSQFSDPKDNVVIEAEQSKKESSSYCILM